MPKTLRLVLAPQYGSMGGTFGEGDAYAVGCNLIEYFTPCIKSTKFKDVDFFYEAAAGGVTSEDLVCYMLPNRSRSVVLKRCPYVAPSQLGGAGSTVWSTKDSAVVSEIYMDATDGDRDRARLVANLIFHEWLHNRLDAPMHVLQDVHKTHGTLTTENPITSSMRMGVPTDVVAMRRGLNHPCAQYAGAL